MNITIENLKNFILSFFIDKIEAHLSETCPDKIREISFPATLLMFIEELAKIIFQDSCLPILDRINQAISELTLVLDTEILTNDQWEHMGAGAICFHKKNEVATYNSITSEIRNELFKKYAFVCFKEQNDVSNKTVVSNISSDISFCCTYGRIVGYLDSGFLRKEKLLYNSFPNLFNVKSLSFLQAICFFLESDIYIELNKVMLCEEQCERIACLLNDIINIFQQCYDLNEYDLSETCLKENLLSTFVHKFILQMVDFFLTNHEAFLSSVEGYISLHLKIFFENLFDEFIKIKKFNTIDDDRFYKDFYKELVDTIKNSLLSFLPVFFVYLRHDYRELQLNVYEYILKVIELIYYPSLINNELTTCSDNPLLQNVRVYSDLSMENLLVYICDLQSLDDEELPIFLDLFGEEDGDISYEENNEVQKSNQYVEEMLGKLEVVCGYIYVKSNFESSVTCCLERIRWQYAKISLKILINFFIKNIFVFDFMSDTELLSFLDIFVLRSIQQHCMDFLILINRDIVKYDFEQIKEIKSVLNFFLEETDVKRQVFSLLKLAVFIKNDEFIIKFGNFFMAYLSSVILTSDMKNIFCLLCNDKNEQNYTSFFDFIKIKIYDTFSHVEFLKNTGNLDDLFELLDIIADIFIIANYDEYIGQESEMFTQIYYFIKAMGSLIKVDIMSSLLVHVCDAQDIATQNHQP